MSPTERAEHGQSVGRAWAEREPRVGRAWAERGPSVVPTDPYSRRRDVMFSGVKGWLWLLMLALIVSAGAALSVPGTLRRTASVTRVVTEDSGVRTD